MKRTRSNLTLLLALMAISCIGWAQRASAQNGSVNQRPTSDSKTDSRILYHNGPVLAGQSNVYMIWYGCWNNTCGFAGDTASQFILADFMSSLGYSPYFQINSTYPNSSGAAPSGGLLFGGSAVDTTYSHGVELTAADIQGIISDQILGSQLPLDPSGIYLVLSSADVSSNATGFCIPNAPPHHGYGTVLGSFFHYGFVGNPMRCPTVGAAQFISSDGSRLPTPDGNLGADAMASMIARVLNEIVTDPRGSGWFDRYGLENADKCDGTFGQTYTTPNGAMANVKLGYRDFLIQQNWVNDRKGRCAMRQ